MTNEQLNRLRTTLRTESTYLSDKELLQALIKDKGKTTEDINKSILSHAIENNWSRRRLYTLLDEIVMEVQNDNKFPENLYDLLTNLLDRLEGNVASEAIIRLNNDPSDQQELSGYVRSLKWIDIDFFLNDR